MPDLARMIAEQGSDLQLRQAIVTSVPAGGTCTIRFGDLASTTTADDIVEVRCLASAPIANGDTVWVLQQRGALLVIGKVGVPIVTGGGVTDHGALTGLADDDHPQYATDGDLTTHAVAADPHTGYQKESEKDAANGYAGLDATGVVPDAKIAPTIARDAEVVTSIANHASAADPHTEYQKESEKNAANGYPGLNASGKLHHSLLGDNSSDYGHFLRVHDTGSSWTLLGDSDIPATIARDFEVTTAVTTHEGASDPHTGYLQETVISGLATPAIVLGTAAAAGTGTTPIRHNSTIAAFDATNPSTQAFADAAAVGAAAFAARRDHKHAMPANPVTAHEAAADPHAGYLKENLGAGWPYTFLSATTFTDPLTGNLKLNNATFASVTRLYIHDNDTLARSHAAFINTWDDSSSGTNRGLITLLADDGDYLILRVSGAVFDQGTWSEVVVAFVDSFGTFANSDAVRVQFDSASDLAAHEAAADPHTGYLKETDISGLATPAIVLGTAAAAGTGTTPIRHNSTIAAFDATAPSTQAFGDAAAVGSAAFAARRDHKHAMPANPVQLATFNTPGALTVVAGKGRFRFPFAVTLLGVTAAINTAPTGAAVILDVNKNGTTIFTTQGNRPTIAISGFATTTEPAPDVTAIASGDYLTVDVDQIGSTIAGSDLTVFVRYRPT